MDKVELISCFRPGDLVRAAVLSLGDSRSYLLTTARNELGVVYAKSAISGKVRVAVPLQRLWAYGCVVGGAKSIACAVRCTHDQLGVAFA